MILWNITPAVAGSAGNSLLNGAELGLIWGLPFFALLVCLALMPIFAHDIWHRHYGKICTALASCFLVPLGCIYGVSTALYEANLAITGHYVPFVIMIGALFTVSGGIRIQMNTHGTARLNTAMLAIGTILAGWIGTTGASMLMIRPLLQINGWRKNIVHLVVFFIFLVSNIGGSATPLGDPPLFLGFLNGVSFFWTLQHLLPETFMMAVPLLIGFYFIDRWYLSREPDQKEYTNEPLNVKISGKFNFLFLGAIISFVLLSGTWKPDFYIPFFGLQLALQDVIRDLALLGIAWISYIMTPHEVYKANHFSWEPLLEVGKIFFAIFITVIPVIEILHAGTDGTLGSLVALVSDGSQPVNYMYFWLTGILSAFLDNAPTYLIFFHMAGGDPRELMHILTVTLEAISLGAVFMGAMTYIGNAPNFMVKAIAEQRGVRMPSFLGYMVWSCAILIPMFIILTLVVF